MKTITTGTEITFIKTNDKFTLTQTGTGFDVKQIKLSKNIPHEPYTFQELLDLYRQGQISIDGFPDEDNALVESILTNYIHGEQIAILRNEISTITSERDTLIAANEQLTSLLSEQNTANQELITANTALSDKNKEFAAEITDLKAKIVSLNATIEAMEEKE